jgi:RNA polymerase sigma factor (sigma-70 family)
VVTVDARRHACKVEGDALLVDYDQRYRPLIERLCRILLRDAVEAEDAAQQTFLLAYQSLLAGTRPRQPRAWLCTIARRECWARTHRIRREHAHAWVQPAAQLDPAEHSVLRSELELLNAGLNGLPARQRQAIVLRELAGLSYGQLAAALDVSESAAEALLVRARRSLRRAKVALLLLPFPPRRALRFARDASRIGRTRSAVVVHAAKAVAVGALVAGTTVVAGAASPAERPAEPAADVAASVVRAPAPRSPRVRAETRPAPARKAPRVLRRPSPRRHAVATPAVVRTTTQAAVVSGTPSVPAPAPTANPAPAPAPAAAAAAAPPTTPAPKADVASKPRTTARPHPKPKPQPRPSAAAAAPTPTPAPSQPPVTTSTTTGTDPAATTPAPPAETTETTPETLPDDS